MAVAPVLAVSAAMEPVVLVARVAVAQVAAATAVVEGTSDGK